MAVAKANTVRHNAIQELAELTANFLFVKTSKKKCFCQKIHPFL
jgi:hypothetical protein